MIAYIIILTSVTSTVFLKPGRGCNFASITLKHIKLCGHDGFEINCKGRDLQSVPTVYTNRITLLKPCVLDLSFNRIEYLGNDAFTKAVDLSPENILYLFLNNNSLINITSEAFKPLEKLRWLDLSTNHLHTFVHIFTCTPNLEYIDLTGNFFDGYKDLDVAFSRLVNLKTFWINPKNETFVLGKKFEGLRKLSEIHLFGLLEGTCSIATISNDTFKYVSTITQLSVVNCNISKIETGALSPLQDLEVLNISYNPHLKFSGMNSALYGLRNSTSLQVLDLTRLYDKNGGGVTVKVEDFENLKSLRKLAVLILD